MTLQLLSTTCFGECDAVALAREQALPWSDWLKPISPLTPAGDDPGYDDDFQHLREEVNKLSGADIERIMKLSQALLLHRCKDLRVATYYLWARLQRFGEKGFADGLSLLAALLERFEESLLPRRPASRKMALEWLAGERVLTSLSRYPEVDRGQTERAVAALVWLEHSVQKWPQDQRPQLGALYAVLSVRLAPQGKVATTDAPSETGSIAATRRLGCMRDVLDNGRLMASYLREQPNGWLAADRLMKSLRWDTVHRPPPADDNGTTRLDGPRNGYRGQLEHLYSEQCWDELLNRVEQVYAEGANHFWLDLQRYQCQALSKRAEPENAWVEIIERDLGAFLKRLPGVEIMSWNDGTPFASEATRDWIRLRIKCDMQPPPVVAPLVISGVSEIFALEGEALAIADRDGLEASLQWLASQPDLHSGRQRWLLRLLMARVSEQLGNNELALHLLGNLDAVAERQHLGEWEPLLVFQVKAQLLKGLNFNIQRGDPDKPALILRRNTLLAALAALDPIRTANLYA